ncbi:MAG: hypothetical protein QUU85_15095, partial [Candidatus Eisenbacteria bacterium]|nr:hypothetical protein [Candidatus Eisenbacteria bacterium]
MRSRTWVRSISRPAFQEKKKLPTLTHRAKADRLAYLLQVARDLERFAPDEDADRMLRHVHRGLGKQLGADLGFAWRLDRGVTIQATYHLCWTAKGEKRLASAPRESLSEEALRFARDRKSPPDPALLLTVVESAGRPIGVLAFLRPGKAFGRSDALFAADAAEILGRSLTHREQERLFEVRERILRKVLLQLRPADVLYQVLHGLKRLLRFDHSASVQTFDPVESTLTVRAETIAWTKAKSRRIGEMVEIDAASRAFLGRIERSLLLDPSKPPGDLPAPLLESFCGSGPGVPPARSIILATLGGPDGLVGVCLLYTSP